MEQQRYREIVKRVLAVSTQDTDFGKLALKLHIERMENRLRQLKDYYYSKCYEEYEIPFEDLDTITIASLENSLGFACYKLHQSQKEFINALNKAFSFPIVEIDTDKIYEESKRRILKQNLLKAKNIRRYLRR